MSATLHIVTNSKGSGDWVVVYETNCGEVVFEGHSIKPQDLFNIINSTNGCYEYVEYHELTDEQMENWQEEI
jgi:hypothetical protein